MLSELQQIMSHFMRGILTYRRASAIFIQKIGSNAPVNRIAAIIAVPEVPISPQPEAALRSLSGRNKSHPWSEYEDQRLLCGITRFGLDNWTEISQFVGNQRTRAQCAQRWFRGLDPRISRVMWTREEELRLSELVKKYGPRAWTRIANELGHRSDTQCRYHYFQMVKCVPIENGAVARDETAIVAKEDAFPVIARRPILPPIEMLIGVSL
jgi:hypothetical protein